MKKLIACILIVAALVTIIPMPEYFEATETVDFFTEEEEKVLKEKILEGIINRTVNIGVEKNMSKNYDLAEIHIRKIIQEIFDEHEYLKYIFDLEEGLTIFPRWISINYESGMSQLANEQLKRLSECINNIVVKIDPNWSDVDKALFLHDYLVQNTAYAKEDAENDFPNGREQYANAYGTLIDGWSICAGYAKTYQILMDKVGIECEYVPSEEMNHAWNIIKIDGEWYHVDCTWDDPTWNREGYVRHEYFLLSDAEMLERGHYGWSASKECTSTKYDAEDHWWSDIESAIRIENSKYYYLSYGTKSSGAVDKKIVLYEVVAGQKRILKEIDVDTYPIFVKMVNFKEGFYFNDEDTIHYMDMETKTVSTVYEYSSVDGSYICGMMVYDDGKIRINESPLNSYVESDAYLEMNMNKVQIPSITNDKVLKQIGTNSTMEYSIDKGKTWVKCTDNMKYSAFGWTEYKWVEVLIRAKTKNGLFPSDTVKISLEAPYGSAPCEHTLNYKEATLPTCAKTGNIAHYYCDKCKKSYKDYEATLEILEGVVLDKSTSHGETEVREKTEATESKTGYTGDTYCTVCNQKTDTGTVIPKLTHTHNLIYVRLNSATCTEAGTIDYYECTKCKKKYDNQTAKVEVTDISIPATGHVRTEVRDAVAATKDEEGYTGDTYCKDCLKMIQVGSIIPRLDHTHSMQRVEGTPATCGKDGTLEYYLCTTCNKKYNDTSGTMELSSLVAPATGKHQNTEVRNAVAATEKKTGYTGDTYCKDCGNLVSKGTVIEKLPHIHQMNKVEGSEVTCTSNGYISYYYCTKCGRKYTDEAGTTEVTNVVIKATGHDTTGAWQSNADQHWKTCGNCGIEFSKENHRYSWKIDKPATENATGIKYEECSCGLKRNENTEIAKLDHVHTGITKHDAVLATCSKNGTIEYWTCSSEKCTGKYYADAECQLEITDISSPIVPENHVYDDELDGECNECKYQRYYEIVSTTNGGAYELDTEGGFEIKIDAEVSLFESISVNGVLLVKDIDFTVKSGSTIITLSNTYLNTLEAGEYVIEIAYTDGKVAKTSLKVKGTEAVDTEIQTPQDTESNNPPVDEDKKEEGSLWLLLIPVVIIGVAAGVWIFLKKRNKE